MMERSAPAFPPIANVFTREICTAVGLFIMLARQSGTRYQMNFEIASFHGFKRFLKTILSSRY